MSLSDPLRGGGRGGVDIAPSDNRVTRTNNKINTPLLYPDVNSANGEYIPALTYGGIASVSTIGSTAGTTGAIITTALDFSHALEGESAGLVVFGQDYAWLGLRKTTTGLRLVLSVAKDAKNGVPQQDSSNQEVRSPVAYLRVTVTAGGTCRFSFSQDNGRFASVGDEFVARPRVWVGAKVGVFSVARPGAAKLGYADWAWFRVEP